MALARVSGRWDEIASVGRVDLQPRLIDVATPVDPVGVVVLLHGGASRGGTMRVSPTQLSVLRMVPSAAEWRVRAWAGSPCFGC
jgi:hypothetical protein